MSRPEPIREWIICISGFLQKYGMVAQGMPHLWHCLRNAHHKEVEVEFYTWNFDADGIAENIFRTSMDNGTKPTVFIAAYSWGGGYGAVRLVRALAERGIRVSVLVMCDAVHHVGGWWTHKLGIAQVLAYNWDWHIKLPRSIDKVISYVQCNSQLRGHKIVWEDNGEPCCEQIVIPLTTHTNMDENAEFRQTTLNEAHKLFSAAA